MSLNLLELSFGSSENAAEAGVPAKYCSLVVKSTGIRVQERRVQGPALPPANLYQSLNFPETQVSLFTKENRISSIMSTCAVSAHPVSLSTLITPTILPLGN